MVDTKAHYGESIPEYYDTCLGPAWFDAFGADLVQRLPARVAGNVLEIACGTGLVTRRLREHIDPRGGCSPAISVRQCWTTRATS
jgi:ubiquinone/menaquinone biosynthesis C-methylase UbiE